MQKFLNLEATIVSQWASVPKCIRCYSIRE